MLFSLSKSFFIKDVNLSVNLNKEVNWGKLKLPESEFIWEQQRNCHLENTNYAASYLWKFGTGHIHR